MNTPGGNTNATAEHTISLLLTLYRNIVLANQSTHNGLWEKKKFKGLELKNKKIGLIGFGNVAKRVSLIAKNFDMEIVTFSKSFESNKKPSREVSGKQKALFHSFSPVSSCTHFA